MIISTDFFLEPLKGTKDLTAPFLFKPSLLMIFRG